jgi:hypothetical protein
MILCFLHWVLMLWDHCTKNRPLRAEVTDRAWGVYHAARTFRPAHLNGFQYHGNWLQNLLVAASLGGRRAPRWPPKVPHMWPPKIPHPELT